MTLTDIFFFFFNDTATTEIYTLSLHDALPISRLRMGAIIAARCRSVNLTRVSAGNNVKAAIDRKSTRLNSSHSQISYAVFCLKKKRVLLHARAVDYTSQYWVDILHTTFSYDLA